MSYGKLRTLKNLLNKRTIFLLGTGASLSCTSTTSDTIVKKIRSVLKSVTSGKITKYVEENLRNLDIPADQVSELLWELQNGRMEAYWLIVRKKEGRRAFVSLKDTPIGYPWTKVPEGYTYLASLIKEGKTSPYILTTNWDELLEVALHQAGLEVKILFGGAQSNADWRRFVPLITDGHINCLSGKTAIVVKLHGTVSNTFSVLGALDDIASLKPVAEQALRRLLAAHERFVTLGWSARDQDIIRVVKDSPRPIECWSMGGKEIRHTQKNFLSGESRFIPGKADELLRDLFSLCCSRKRRNVRHRRQLSQKSKSERSYDKIYAPMLQDRNICYPDEVLASQDAGIMLIHAANRKELPTSPHWDKPRNTFFSPYLDLSETKWVDKTLTKESLPKYAIVDLTYPGDYPFAANSKDMSHSYRLIKSLEERGFSLPKCPLNVIMNEVQVTSAELGRVNVICLGGPDSNRWVLFAAMLRENQWASHRLPLRMWYAMPDMTYRADSDTLWHDFTDVPKYLNSPIREFKLEKLGPLPQQHYGMVLIFPNPFSKIHSTWFSILAGLQNTGTQAAMLAFSDIIKGNTPVYRFRIRGRNKDNWAYCVMVTATRATQNPIFNKAEFTGGIQSPSMYEKGNEVWDPSYLITDYEYLDLGSKRWCR